MPCHKIRIITDKSNISRHHAELLAKGSACSTNDIDEVTIGDLARSPSDASMGQTSIEDINLYSSNDALLFSSTGALSLFEKHFQHESDHSPLKSNKVGIVMFPHSTFDDPGTTHPTDQHLISLLDKFGLDQDPIIFKANYDNNDNEIMDIGKSFADLLE
ncbi:unnamed protein product [Cunninghamella echinulata]